MCVVTVVMAMFCWDHRFRVTHWLQIGSRERADAALNWGLLGFFLYATIQRAIATYSFLREDWRASVFATVMPFYLPLAAVSILSVIWWACYHRHGARRRKYWLWWTLSGLFLFSITFTALI
jgi:hypothetical protein